MRAPWSYGLILVSVYLVTGLIESGYHMMEDHEILFNHLLFKQVDLRDYAFRVWNESGNRLSRGLNVYLGIFSAMFGSRWWMWHSLVLTTLALALHQFQLLGLKFGLSRYTSFLLPLMLVIGTPTELMTRLATIESVSLLISGILLNRIAASKLGWKTLGFVLLLFFTKESFVLLGPFIVMFAYFCETDLRTNLKSSLNKLRYFSGGVLVICLLFAAAFFVADTTNTEADYVLGEPSALLSNVISYFTHVYHQQWLSSTPMPYLIILAALCFSVYIRKQGSLWFWIIVAIGSISIVVQVLLLSSVGYSGRYLIPSLIVLCVMFITGMSKLSGAPQRGVISIALMVVFSFQGFWSKKMIDEYVDSGRAIQQLTNYVVDSCQAPGSVLLVGDPLLNIEMFDALITYFAIRAEDMVLDVKILPTEPDLERFSELAEIYDSSAIERFKRGFQDHYEDRLVTNCLNPFQLVVVIGEQHGFENICPSISSKETSFTVGKSWYLFNVVNTEHINLDKQKGL